MTEVLFWLCVVNTSLLIVHEIDAAYWKEWRMFRTLADNRITAWLEALSDEQGIGLFTAAHFPLLVGVLYGLTLTGRGGGVLFSLGMGLFLVIHFLMHRQTNKSGRLEFSASVSKWTLFTSCVTGLIQSIAAAYVLLR